ncbi:DNA gyrase subunit A [Candidatus Peregrinibacteria bacterium]|nr:DNA gyrase subunit A [Candidatus Peregrinibacteria bacterium]
MIPEEDISDEEEADEITAGPADDDDNGDTPAFVEIGKVDGRDIVNEMKESYLDYAMSVIVSRALPDVRDGLKPVHRRILYSMHELGLRSGAKFRKSAAVVGDVLAKYHPHGDSAVYDSMVHMAQDFKMRYPLVYGQGNFGSMDGDNAAAMRYTEAKMHKITDELMADIEKETVDFRPNYDGRLKEPVVLPSRIPALLLNGSMGIAVGMATNIPPHNLREVMNAILHLIKNPEATIEDLMEFVKGPDFPTGGMIYDIEAIKTAYATGRGSIVMRGKAEIEELKGGKFRIVVTEIPFQINKAALVEKIAMLVTAKTLKGISDIRDESSRKGVRVVIELKRDAYPKKVLNQLYKYTNLQTSFGFNMIGLVNGIQPRLLDLKLILSQFIEHRQEVIRRRTEYELKVAQARAHILEGLKVALDHIDEVIALIKKSETKETAKEGLMKKFKLTEIQAKAILEMRLQTLAGLERQKIEDELKEKLDFIKECEIILADPKRVLAIISSETQEIIDKYGDDRRTEVIPNAIGQFNVKQLIPDEDMVVILTKGGYIKRLSPTVYRTQGRGGKGVIGMTTKEEDEISQIIHTRTHNNLLFFTDKGRVFRLPVYEIPQASRTARGQAIVNLLQLTDNEHVTVMFDDFKREGNEFLFMATTSGTVKKTKIEDFKNVRKTGLIAIKLRPSDLLRWVKPTKEGNQIVIVTHEGKCIRFKQEDVRPMGRNSMGVRGIRLKGQDHVVQMDVVTNEEASRLLVVMENGLSKSTNVSKYRFQNRGGTGVKTASLTSRTGKLVGARILEEGMDGDMIIISRAGQMIRLPLKEIPTSGRATQGVYVMRLKDQDKVASISLIEEEKKAGNEQELPLQ